jgi:AcrR family transcriptional regulator
MAILEDRDLGAASAAMPKGLSQRAHQKVLETAAELFADRGIDTTSMDAIAAKSRVSKATIYKHWSDKEALCMEVMTYLAGLDAGPPKTDSGDWKADTVAFLMYEAPPRTEAIKRRLMPHLIAYSARNEEFGRAWRARAMERIRAGLKELVRRGIERGIFPAVLDEELAVALLVGPMMFRHIFRGSLDKEWLARGAVEGFWRANARDAKGPRDATGSAPEVKLHKRPTHKGNGKPAPAH